MSSEPISPSNFAPLSASARFSACSSKSRGSRPSAISFGRSVISPMPTMTGTRSSGRGEVFSGIVLVSLSNDQFAARVPSPSFRDDAQHRTRNLEIPRCATAHLRSGANAPSRNDGGSLPHHRFHALQRLGKGFLEFLYHAPGGFL